MELRHLRYFLAVAEELHFGRAAQRLHISQPPLSTQIRDLEEELEVVLLERTQRHVKLTKAGKLFRNRVQAILTDVERATEEVRALDRGEMDTLRIGYKSAIMLIEVAPMLHKFQTKFPNVQLKFVQCSVSEQYGAVSEHRLDIGFVDAPIGKTSENYANDNITGIPVLKERIKLALPKDHPLAHRKRVSLREFHNDNFIFLDRQAVPSVHDLFIGMCQEAGFSPKIKCYAPQLTEIMAHVAAGGGVSFAPESLADSWLGLIKFVPLKEKVFVTITAIFHIEHRSKAAREFSKLITENADIATH